MEFCAPVPNTLEKCKNSALFLRLDRPSNRKRSLNRRNLETPILCFSVDVNILRLDRPSNRKRASNRRNLETPILCFLLWTRTFWKRIFSKKMTSRPWPWYSPAARVVLEHKWALCTIRSHGTKLHILMSKLHSGTSKTMQLVLVRLDLSLIWNSHYATYLLTSVCDFCTMWPDRAKGTFKMAAVIDAFSNSSGVVWTENIWRVFRV